MAWGDPKHIKQLKEGESVPDFADTSAMPPVDPSKKVKEKQRDDDGYLEASKKAAKYSQTVARPPQARPKSFLATVFSGHAERKRDRAIIEAHKATKNQQQPASKSRQGPRGSNRVDLSDGLYTGPRSDYDGRRSAYHDPAYGVQSSAERRHVYHVAAAAYRRRAAGPVFLFVQLWLAFNER